MVARLGHTIPLALHYARGQDGPRRALHQKAPMQGRAHHLPSAHLLKVTPSSFTTVTGALAVLASTGGRAVDLATTALDRK